MELPREVIKWLQYLNLSYSFKSIKNASNGIIVSEIINTYIPQTINMNSLENGFGKDIKRKNWQIIKKVLTSLSISFDEISIINSDKNAITNLFVNLYEYFNEKKIKNDLYSAKGENNELTVPSFARSTITQKIRESNVHDIIDEEKKMLSTYEIIKGEEYKHTMMRTRKKEEEENKDKIKHMSKKTGLNKTSLFDGLEKSSSIITINDTSSYMDYTDIKTLDSFIKDKNNLTSVEFMKNTNVDNESECHKIHNTGYTDENMEDIIANVLKENISHYVVEKENKSLIACSANMVKEFYKFPKFELCDENNVNNLYEKFFVVCSLKRHELIDKILNRLKLFNENFYLILSLRGYHTKCDSQVFTSIMNYLKQLLTYLRIKSTTSEVICNTILKGLFSLDNDENKDIRCFCELIVLLINNDGHTLMNILRMIKNTMSSNFFYHFLLTLLNSSTNSFIYQKGVKDIYLYYLFTGLHTNKENIMLKSLDMLNTLSLLEGYEEIIHLSGLLENILEINNINYNTFLFVISCNILFKMKENQMEGSYNTEIKQFITICSRVLTHTKTKKLLYFFFLCSHKILSMDDEFFDLYLKRYNELSDEEQKMIIRNEVFDGSLKKMFNYKMINKYFSNIFSKNLNFLNEKKNMEFFGYLEIYEKIYEYVIETVFLESSPDFELSKEILSFFWLSSDDELKVQSFKISLSHFENLLSLNKHNLGLHTKEYLEKTFVFLFFFFYKMTEDNKKIGT
ncbi:hypothetical protein, conserved [Plasmodium gonderi]|uniref:CH-like domain-containing protein n=1 Tax=Plasmodium gonderi TaxID=77519 RepID=A0A1Y1JJP0_PLAGO|nr:hypothetical protein, conserved [Plasmodium gonderi]GAW82460.1 hypothetical protein, conserved [Plasmodium gonderi]